MLSTSDHIMSLHVAYLDESLVVVLKIAPSGIPCMESYRHESGLDILLYKVDNFWEFKKLSSKNLKIHSSVPGLLFDVSRYLRRKNTVRSVYLIRKLQGSGILFAELPESMVSSPEAYTSLVTLRTDNGMYDIKALDFNLEIQDCHLCVIYRDINSLGGDMLSVSMWRALTMRSII